MGSGLTDPRQAARSADPDAKVSISDMPMCRKKSCQRHNTMLESAVRTLSPDEHPVVHNDRGCHYRWSGWVTICEENGLVRSMSRKGCSPDNSAMEGFFGRMKVEMFYGRSWRGVSIEGFMDAVDAYIRWYNSDRIKVTLDGMSPVQYRESRGLAA